MSRTVEHFRAGDPYLQARIRGRIKVHSLGILVEGKFQKKSFLAFIGPFYAGLINFVLWPNFKFLTRLRGVAVDFLDFNPEVQGSNPRCTIECYSVA